eukprot:TRINITY_DN47_c0_g1_i1.p1 TRINITY_DN47_c0_g1~~TRINITY_DN47_c0_g1_i1.p1  ORF type:complete len:168 (-),score=22.12 TRINITY_DN47_c0_g1_i1:198-701(-)
MEACYCEWPEDKGNDWCYCLSCMECCEPCCGSPCDVVDGLFCAVSGIFFLCCMGPKCLSYTQNQDCHLVNHCLPFFLVILSIIPGLFVIPYFVFWTTFRVNLRKMHGIGEEGCGLCDCLTGCIIPGPCLACQELRSIPKEGWDWYAAFGEGKYPAGASAEECIMFCV